MPEVVYLAAVYYVKDEKRNLHRRFASLDRAKNEAERCNRAAKQLGIAQGYIAVEERKVEVHIG